MIKFKKSSFILLSKFLFSLVSVTFICMLVVVFYSESVENTISNHMDVHLMGISTNNNMGSLDFSEVEMSVGEKDRFYQKIDKDFFKKQFKTNKNLFGSINGRVTTFSNFGGDYSEITYVFEKLSEKDYNKKYMLFKETQLFPQLIISINTKKEKNIKNIHLSSYFNSNYNIFSYASELYKHYKSNDDYIKIKSDFMFVISGSIKGLYDKKREKFIHYSEGYIEESNGSIYLWKNIDEDDGGYFLRSPIVNRSKH